MPSAITNILDRLAYDALRLLPAEPAHDLGKWVMRRRLLAPGPVSPTDVPRPALFGTTLPNPLGLAAGFDKNAELVDAAIDYGFGFVEVGSVTFAGGAGNPRPRMFRLDHRTIMNRMGLNGDPAPIVAARLGAVKSLFFGVNIAKTHSPDILGDAAIDDILGSYRLLRGFGLYTAINVSCPNTREGRTFEEPEALAELLAALAGERTPEARPLLVKLSPVLDPVQSDGAARLAKVIDVCESAGVAGYVCCNTLPHESARYGRGGLSGDAVRPIALRMVEFIRRQIDRVVIGCGGVYSHGDLMAYLDRGCVAVQAYNGFVRGPAAGIGFARRVLGDAHGRG